MGLGRMGLRLAVALLAMGSALALSSSGRPARSRRQQGRAVFVAGLEGTGHHVWATIFENCIAAGRCRKMSDALQAAVWPASARNLPAGSDGLFSLSSLSESWRSEQLASVSPLLAISLGTGSTGMLSYPNFSNPPRIPRMDLYAQAAAANGDDLRVILMLRNAGELQESDFRRWRRQPADLVRAAEALLQQVRGLDRRNVLCVEYESMDKFGPAVNALLSRGSSAPPYNIGQVLKDVFEAGGEDLPPPKADPALESAMSQLRAFCNDAPLDTQLHQRSLADDRSLMVTKAMNYTDAAVDFVDFMVGAVP